MSSVPAERGPIRWLVPAIVLAGLCLRAWHYLRCPSVWHDEAALLVNVLQLDFGQLLGPLDTELAEPDRFTHETHVSGCAACSARQAAWARRATRVSNLLREIDLPTPTTGLRIAVVPRLEPVAIRWRIAAVVTLALAGAAAVPPVRAWIVEAAKTAWARVWVPTAGRSHQGPIDAAESGAVSFVPTGPALTIRVPARGRWSR